MADISKIKLPDGTTYNVKDTTKLPTSGGTVTGAISLTGTDFNLKTSGTSSDDSGDIVWYYGNGQEKARLWTNNEYTTAVGLNYRVYKKDGTNLITGTIPLENTNTTYTLSTSGNNIVLTPSSGSANTITVPYATDAGSVGCSLVEAWVPDYYLDIPCASYSEGPYSSLIVPLNGPKVNSAGRVKCKDIDPGVFYTETLSDIITYTGSACDSIKATFTRVGRLCQLTIQGNRKTSCGGGSDIMQCTLAGTASTYKPTNCAIRSGSFIGNRAVGMEINVSGSITIRNASATTINANTGFLITSVWIYTGDF